MKASIEASIQPALGRSLLRRRRNFRTYAVFMTDRMIAGIPAAMPPSVALSRA